MRNKVVDDRSLLPNRKKWHRKVLTEEVDDELAEKDRLRGGQADNAGVGEIDGEGEESLVKRGE